MNKKKVCTEESIVRLNFGPVLRKLGAALCVSMHPESLKIGVD